MAKILLKAVIYHFLNFLSSVASRGNVSIKIAQNFPKAGQPNLDTEELAKYDSVQVKSLNFPALVGAGILHTKLWIIDR